MPALLHSEKYYRTTTNWNFHIYSNSFFFFIHKATEFSLHAYDLHHIWLVNSLHPHLAIEGDFLSCAYHGSISLLYIQPVVYSMPSSSYWSCQSNLTIYSAILHIVDSIPPVIACTNDLSQTVNTGVTGTTVTWTEPTATDNSGIVSLTSRTHAPGSFFPVGTTQVTYTFTDGAGNSASCTFSVTVIEG